MSRPLVAVISADNLTLSLAGIFGEVTPDYEEADIIMFTGGADVHPSLYGEGVLPKTSPQYGRDIEEISIYERMSFRKDKRRAFVGICRGGQFLNVMNGGRLWQHVEGHTRAHPALCLDTNKVYHVSSTHHQQFRLPRPADAIKYKVLAVALSDDKVSKRTDTEKFTAAPEGDRVHDQADYEAVWYPESRSLCFQPHPEYTPFEECRAMFLDYINRYVVPSLKEKN